MGRHRNDAIRTGYLPTDAGTPHRWTRSPGQHTHCAMCRVLRCEHDVELTASSHGTVGPGRRGYWYADPDERVFRPGVEPECRKGVLREVEL